MRSDYRSKKDKPKLLYDARGMRIQNNRFSNKLKHALLFYALPYLVINGLIFMLVTTAPKIDIKVVETNDYRTTQVEFTVNSLLPLKSLTADIESKEVEFTKEGSTYTATVDLNGTFYVDAIGINGMHGSASADVSVLDATAPILDAENCEISGGDLQFIITDSQSGVNFESIYGIYKGGEVRPTSYDPETGIVIIPFITDSLEIHAEDMVGNAVIGNISATTDYTGSSDAAEDTAAGEADESDTDEEDT